MPMYRKKPVVIEARQFWPHTQVALGATGTIDSKSSDKAIAAWCGGNVTRDALGPCIEINTLEGTMLARPGDWIIKGVKGEFYPIKYDIFAATYEVAE